MAHRNPNPPVCPIHGKPTHRESCSKCNAAYMRDYLRKRRLEKPALEMWHRAKKRADRLGLKFTLSRDAVFIPDNCPVLGVPLDVTPPRSAASPSLDRIDPHGGYVDLNIRVISDHSNRLKADKSLAELRARADSGPKMLRSDYVQIAAYVEREALLAEVRKKAALGGNVGAEWAKIALFLDRAFREGDRFLHPARNVPQ